MSDSLSIGEWAPEGGDSGRPQTGHAVGLLAAQVLALRSTARTICSSSVCPLRATGPVAPAWSGGELGIAVAEGEGVSTPCEQSDSRAERPGPAAHGEIHLRRRRSALLRDRLNPQPGWAAERPGALERLESTRDFWREGCAMGDSRPPLADTSATFGAVLKGLAARPTGAIVAAATTSPPATPRRRANWELRFSWIHDSTFSLWAMHTLGFDEEARDFIEFLVRILSEDPVCRSCTRWTAAGDLTERTLDHLSGYRGVPAGSGIGNGAYSQRQNDVSGSTWTTLPAREGDPHRPDRLWEMLVRRPGGDRGLAASRPGDLGGRR